MRIRIRARDSNLEARCFGRRGRWRDEADGSSAVFEAPGNGDGGPEVFDEAFVAVYRWGEEGHYVGQTVEQAGEEVAAQVGEMLEVGVGGGGVWGGAVEEVRACGGGGQGDVHVAAVAGEAFSGFGHEAGGYGVFAADAFGYVSMGEGMDLASDSLSARRGKGCIGDVLEEGGLVGHRFDLAVF